MEVTGNMNIDMEALEQELQSPMALSYGDLNLYSSWRHDTTPRTFAPVTVWPINVINSER